MVSLSRNISNRWRENENERISKQEPREMCAMVIKTTAKECRVKKNQTITTLLVSRKLTQVQSALIHTLNRALCGFTHTLSCSISQHQSIKWMNAPHTFSLNHCRLHIKEHNEASGNTVFTNMQKHTWLANNKHAHFFQNLWTRLWRKLLSLFPHSQSLTVIVAHA